jgi:hypothetical protein
LYVDASGPYLDLVQDDQWYDAARGARAFPGDRPVVAHPPCGPWGKFAWKCTNQGRETGFHAVDVVRRCGGVLEHPVGSGLFDACDIPTAPWTPDRQVDAFGGYTIRVCQFDHGHRGAKDTILYIVGTADLPPLLRRESGTPRPIERMGKRERRLTPPAFAWWLCVLAARCKVTDKGDRGS